MDNQEAKFILKAYRPGGADAGNAVFCEALAQAQRDPGLRTWFEREQARDKAVAAKLKSVPIPAGLRESILAGGKMSASRRSWWQQPMWLALAASVAILLTATVVWQLRGPRMDWYQLTVQILDDAAQGERHGSHGAAAKELVAMVSLPTTKLSALPPVDLNRLKTEGCRTLTVAGHEVMEVCFERNGGEFHLYVMVRPQSRNLPNGPQFAAHNGMHSVLWADAQHLYVMASAKDDSALKALL
jgi:hypothetical protein